MHLFKLTDEQLTQMLIPERFVPPTPPEYEGKNMVYVFDSEDSFNLTYDELVEIIRKARQAGPRMVPVIGTVS
ncbi:hypothetical protein [Acinetobacter junii]|jgi:hypothetical protein|uniref:hypothetical protein n=1 Tax=Acinetobacter junii TaxID=40215 RepID=UPI000F65C008|nr:hypothetical protein [Acinetobacter junii]MDA3509332.1 hypothetical protein [Acinetobacter junii]MDA3533631.1 hypothetical protein [Acinetobacter junii]MDH1858822.1 hypothetical protein [Acinetobacter junii]MDI9721731.1 hypothetical protein [Acinetobacter junii]RSE30786.1 hypothetical protein EGT62_14825 [Acinetobacter junii]